MDHSLMVISIKILSKSMTFSMSQQAQISLRLTVKEKELCELHMKHLKQKDLSLALLIYRTTTIQNTGYCPAPLMLSHQLQTQIRVLEEKQHLRWSISLCWKQLTPKPRLLSSDTMRDVSPLPQLQLSNSVAFKLDNRKSWTTITTAPKSYLMHSSDGVLRRIRQYLLLVPPSPLTELKRRGRNR